MTFKRVVSELNISEMPKKLLVDRRRVTSQFAPEDQENFSMCVMDVSSDRRGLFLAASGPGQVNYFNREAEKCSILYKTEDQFCVNNVLLLAADETALLTLENNEGSISGDF